jgi:hypothetical protein
MFALGQRPAEDVRIMRLACGPNIIWITARTALGGKVSHVRTFIFQPVAKSATPLALAIGKERVDRMPISGNV